MRRRFVSLYFPYLLTDWYTNRDNSLKNLPVVVCGQSHGRIIIKAVNAKAAAENIQADMVLADARAVVPSIHVINEQSGVAESLLKKIAEWCIRFTPVTAVDLPHGILLDVSGCSHLWGGDEEYVGEIVRRISAKGYTVKAAIADTIGCAWGVARNCKTYVVVNSNEHLQALSTLNASALRIDEENIDKLDKLGLRLVKDFIHLPKEELFRRFGSAFITRINQALGDEEEIINPLVPVHVYSERVPCLEPIVSAGGIEIAIEEMLQRLCIRLINEQMGMRKAVLSCYRIDNKILSIEIITNRPSSNKKHLYKLFQEKISSIEPGEGIELFILEAAIVEKHLPQQDTLWETIGRLNDSRLSELLDKLSSRVGSESINRYVPSPHYWPERSYKKADHVEEEVQSAWNIKRPRPIHLLKTPEHIQVTAPIPDYPPMLFRHKGKLHKILKADGPERIEQEWWLQEGEHRDYYTVEDESGNRYWLFRSGHYESGKSAGWFLHGYYA